MSTTPSKLCIAKRISSLFATNKPTTATPSSPQKEQSSTTLNEGTPSGDSYVKIDHPINPSPPNSPPKKKFFSTMLSKKKETVPVVVAKENDQVESSSRTFEASPPKKSFANRVSSFFKFGQPAPINTADVPPATTTVIPEIVVQSPCDQAITVDFDNLGHGGEEDEEQISLLKKVSMELEGAEVGGVFIKSFDEAKDKKKAVPVVEEKNEVEKDSEVKEEAVEKKAKPVIKKEEVVEKKVEPVIKKEEVVEKITEPVVAKVKEKANGTTIGGQPSPSTPAEPASNASKNKKKINKKKNKSKK
jgi:hypothetical protein